MAAVRCRCGQAFRVPAGVRGGQVRCPACGVVGDVPAQPPEAEDPGPAERPQRLSFGLLLAGLATLSVALGVVFLFLWSYWRTEAAPEGPPPEPAPLPNVGDLFPPTRRPGPAPPPDTPAPEDPTPVTAPPAVEVVRTEPPEPRADRAFLIMLRTTGPEREGLVLQYRLPPEEEWRPARGRRVRLEGLAPGRLTVEFRAVDAGGRASAVLSRTWAVREKPAPPAPAPGGGYRPGESFYQEVVVGRVSDYRVNKDSPTAQNTRYSFLSRFTVEEVQPDGSLVLTQKVEGARLDRTEEALKARLGELLGKARGATFRVEVDARGGVVGFHVQGEPLPSPGGGKPLDRDEFPAWSFPGRAGWEELARLTFFRPPEEAEWDRPASYPWGPLGKWEGTARFARRGKKDGLAEFAYTLDLHYQRPGKAEGLPFRITGGDFETREAGGSLLFDPARGRVFRAQQQFRVAGRLQVVSRNGSAVLAMDESQTVQVSVTDNDPWDKEKPAAPPGG